MTALENAYQNALAIHANKPAITTRLGKAYKLTLDPRVKVLDNAIDVPSESRGFIVIGWARAESGCMRVGACECADYLKHGAHWWCKHRLCVALILKATEIEHPEPCEPISALWKNESDEDAAPLTIGFSALEELGKQSMIDMRLSEDEFIKRWPLSAYARKLNRERNRQAMYGEA